MLLYNYFVVISLSTQFRSCRVSKIISLAFSLTSNMLINHTSHREEDNYRNDKSSNLSRRSESRIKHFALRKLLAHRYIVFAFHGRLLLAPLRTPITRITASRYILAVAYQNWKPDSEICFLSAFYHPSWYILVSALYSTSQRHFTQHKNTNIKKYDKEYHFLLAVKNGDARLRCYENSDNIK